MKQAYRTLPLLVLAAAVQDANAYFTAFDDATTMVKDSGSITINVLANDVTTNNDTVFITSSASVSEAYGSVVVSQDNKTLTYTPAAGFVGRDTFTYGAQNFTGYGGSASVVVIVTETEVVVQPPANDDLVGYVTGARNKAVAGMLDEACPDNNLSSNKLSKLNANPSEVYDGCYALKEKIRGEGENPDQIVAEIAPDEALTQRQLLAQNARNNTSNIYRSMALLRSENPGAASVSINQVTLPSGGGAGDGLGSPWTLLSSIQVEDIERDLTANEAGYDGKGRSLMLGLGYRLNNNLNLGAALDWTNYDVDYLSKGGSLDSDIYNLTSFLSWYQGPLSVDIQAGYASGQSDAQRRFTFPSVTTANSSYDSSQLNLSSRVEWAWQSGALALRPFVRVDYVDSDIDGYAETGNGVWLMQAGKQKQEQTNASVGLDTSYTLSFSWGVMTPNLKMSLVSQDNISSDPVAFQLINAGSDAGQFQLETDELDSRFYQWELNSVMVLKNGLSSFIALQTISDYDNVSSYRISAGLNKEF